MHNDLRYELLPSTLQEAHRRAATHFSVPALVIHRAYYHPFLAVRDKSLYSETSRANQHIAIPYFQLFLDYVDINISPNTASLIFNKYREDQPNSAGEPQSHLYYHIYDARSCQGDIKEWAFDGLRRIEFHREFICLSWFVPVEIESKQGAVSITAKSFDSSKNASIVEASDESSFFEELMNCGHRKITSKIDIDSKFDIFCDNYEIDSLAAPKLFADIYGVVLPAEALKVWPESRLPTFPDPLSATFATKNERSEALTSAAYFLDYFWKKGLARFLYGPTSRNGVACYMQNGHILYMSGLGAREIGHEKAPLSYIALYSDQRLQNNDQATINSTREIISWRISRFVGRLHDSGVARLAALRNFEAMKSFNHLLRKSETKLQKIDMTEPSSDEIKLIEKDIAKKASEVDESVVHRSMRAAYYLTQVDRLSEDMGVISIPGFQDYRHFIRRYLIQSVEVVASVGRRYEELNKQISTKFSIANSISSIDFQRTAEVAACAIVLYYINQLVDKQIWKHLVPISGEYEKLIVNALSIVSPFIIPICYLALGAHLRNLIFGSGGLVRRNSKWPTLNPVEWIMIAIFSVAVLFAEVMAIWVLPLSRWIYTGVRSWLKSVLRGSRE